MIFANNLLRSAPGGRWQGLFVDQVVEVCLMPKSGVGAKLGNKGKALDHCIPHAGIVKLAIDGVEPPRHLVDARLIVGEIVFQARQDQRRDSFDRVLSLSFCKK